MQRLPTEPDALGKVFVSYTHEDRAKAKVLADGLSARGWSVWWDRTIPPGRTFDEVIEEALDDAQCVVVLWSTTSIASNWVRAEAAEGARGWRDQGCLPAHPATILRRLLSPHSTH